MPAAISYIRFSSDRQKHGTSTERQRQMVKDWLLAHPEYTPSNLTYEDVAKSAYKGKHLEAGRFGQLLEAIEAGLIKAGDVVLCEAIDRVGRMDTSKMLGKIILPITEAGVSIITLDDGHKYDSQSINTPAVHLLMAKIQAAHGYSQALSDRTKANYAIRVKNAKETGKVKRNTPIWLHSNGEPNEIVAPYIKQVFELYVSGVGKTAIANRLRASGVPELATCSGPTVESWLRNQAAIGNWEYGKDDPDKPSEVIRGVYPPVVSDELFLQAQLRKRAVATKPRERTSKHFLVGLVKCGVCGANYIIHNKDAKPNNMRCGTHHRLKSAGCVNGETIPYQVVCKLYMSTAHSFIGKALDAIQLTENDKRKLALNADRDKLSVVIATLTDKVEDFDMPELWEKLRAANDQRKKIDEELSILDRPTGADQSRKQTADIIYNSAVEHDRMFRDDPIQLSALLRQAGYAITVHTGHRLFVSGDAVPLIYVGTARKGNKTLGYRVFENGHEFVISPEIPEVPNVQRLNDMPTADKSSYLANRSSKVVSMSLAVNVVEDE